MSRGAGAVWIQRPRPALEPVSKLASGVVPTRPSPDAHVSGSHLDSEVLLRVPSRPVSPPAAFRPQARLTGSRPSSRHHRAASTHRGGRPALRYVPSSGFRSLSTVCSAIRLGRRVPSCRHVQGSFHRSGVSLPPQLRLPHRKAHAPMPLPVPRSPGRTQAATPSPPRLRGLHPRRAALRASGVQP
jgi:hypothetical protein